MLGQFRLARLSPVDQPDSIAALMWACLHASNCNSIQRLLRGISLCLRVGARETALLVPALSCLLAFHFNKQLTPCVT